MNAKVWRKILTTAKAEIYGIDNSSKSPGKSVYRIGH